MRLTPTEVATIQSVCQERLPAGTRWSLRVFGSCLDDRTSGGDVDLYLEMEGLNTTDLAAVARDLRPALEDALDRPVDLVVQDPLRPLKAVAGVARERGVLIAGAGMSEKAFALN